MAKKIVLTLALAAIISVGMIPAISQAGENVFNPDHKLLDLNGNEVNFADYTGKVVLLNFWATWCPPCRKEIPHFIEIYDELKDKDFVIIGVTVSDKLGNAQKFVKSTPINYPLVMDGNGISQVYQNMLPPDKRGYVPYTLIFDKEGKLQHTHVGYNDKASWLSMINPLLK